MIVKGIQKTFAAILCASLLAIAVYFWPTEARYPLLEFTGNAMTMDYRIVIVDSLSPNYRIIIDKLINTTFNEVNFRYNRWNKLSELSFLNKNEDSKVKISSSLYTFLEQIDQFVAVTDGRFDPTIEPLLRVWKEALWQGKEPEPGERLNKAQRRVGWRELVHLQDGALERLLPQVELDLGGVAKGYAVDLLVERLKTLGIGNLYVEWGGEVRAAGKHPSGRPWRVGIVKVEGVITGEHETIIELKDQAVATSGDYLQNWEVVQLDGSVVRYCHIVDPVKLRPIKIREGGVASVTVVANSCAYADALATAAMLSETPEEAESWLSAIHNKDPTIRFWVQGRR